MGEAIFIDKKNAKKDVTVLERLFGIDNVFFGTDGHVVVLKQQHEILFELTIDPEAGRKFFQEGAKLSS